jgi:hypothetical protein
MTKDTKYVIRTTRFFYGPREEKGLFHEPGHMGFDALTFDTREEAQEYVNQLESGVHYLQHGESSRPDYKVVTVSSLPKFLKGLL